LVFPQQLDDVDCREVDVQLDRPFTEFFERARLEHCIEKGAKNLSWEKPIIVTLPTEERPIVAPVEKRGVLFKRGTRGY
jgi:hypothetical protein